MDIYWMDEEMDGWVACWLFTNAYKMQLNTMAGLSTSMARLYVIVKSQLLVLIFKKAM